MSWWEKPEPEPSDDRPRLVRVTANQHGRREEYADEQRPEGPLLRKRNPRQRKDRHVPYGPMADASPVERTSQRATNRTLNLSEQDRWDRSREAQVAQDPTIMDRVVGKGGLPALTALAEMRDRLPRE